ncbi:rhodanese-like domain-containing protein [Pseudonocardia sichuanensis]
MDPKTVYERRQDVQLLDVREDDEWNAGRIEGAVHIPLAQLPARLAELDRDPPVVTVCRSGGRAGKASEHLTQAGLTAETMAGGMTAWSQAGLPFTAPDGGPGRVA